MYSVVHPDRNFAMTQDILDIGVQNVLKNRDLSKYVIAMGKELLKYLNQRVYIRRRNRHVIATHLVLACFMIITDLEGQ